MRRVLMFAGVLVLITAAQPGWAEEHSRPLTDTDYVDAAMGKYHHPSAFDKFGRGISNVLGGWLEVPLNLQQKYSERDTAGSIVTGTLCGLVYAVYRTGVGVYETATFFLPLPANYEPILPTLPYFRKEPSRKPLLWE